MAVALVFAAAANAGIDGPTRITCNPHFGTGQLKSEPGSCIVAPANQPAAKWTRLQKLRWTNWGNQSARFEGRSKALHYPFDKVPASGRAFRLRPFPCGGDYAIYTRLKVRTRFGTRTLRLDRIC